MDDRLEKEEEKTGELIKIKFRMDESPVAVQITKHINNLLLTYPAQRKQILTEFKRTLTTPELKSLNFRIGQLVDHYGVFTFRTWFKDIYGWSFNQNNLGEKNEKRICN